MKSQVGWEDVVNSVSLPPDQPSLVKSLGNGVGDEIYDVRRRRLETDGYLP